MYPEANLLGDESSPYLRQHADNPVYWRPWGRSALDEARDTGKPILLSVGYAACHWCHVMAHECFEDLEVAELMNRHFVNVKVDREERPDIDQIYMAALGAMGEQGGWPLTMFLTPDAGPFWGGTYFPKTSRYGRPGFMDILASIHRVWQSDKQKIANNVTALTRHLQANLAVEAEPGTLDPEIFDQFATNIFAAMDTEKGGLRGAPKFPNAPFMDTLWLSWLRNADRQHRDAFLASLGTMLQGGIYDHLGGGLSRYAVDDRWLVPHFEKMLYDNAHMIRHALWAFDATGDELFRRRIEETVDWLRREMLIDGRFASSLDADSEGEEGKFYCWSAKEIPDSPEFTLFREIYDVTPEGNWEHKTILNRLAAGSAYRPELEQQLEPIRRQLFEIREKRVHPTRDEKALTDWNGLMIRALAEAGRALERPDWVLLAQTAYDQIRASMKDGRVPHSVLGESRLFPGLSSDYAAMINAAVSLYQATFEEDYIAEATQWLEILNADHRTGPDEYSFSAARADDVIIRIRGDQDEAISSATSQIIEALTRLAIAGGSTDLLEQAERVAAKAVGRVLHQRYGQAGILNSASLLLEPIKLVLVTPTKDHELVQAAARMVDPRRTDIWVEWQHEQAIELIPGGGAIAIEKPAAYLCRGFSCLPPVASAGELEELLQQRLPG